MLLIKNCFTSGIYGICCLKMSCLLLILLRLKLVCHIDLINQIRVVAFVCTAFDTTFILTKKTFCNIWRTVSNRDLLITKNYFTSRIYGICWLKMPCLLPLLLGFKVVRHIDGWPLIHLSFHSSLTLRYTVCEKFNLRLPAQNGIWVKFMTQNSFIQRGFSSLWFIIHGQI